MTADRIGRAYRPEGWTSARLGLPFCVATLLLERGEAIAEPQRQRLIEATFGMRQLPDAAEIARLLSAR